MTICAQYPHLPCLYDPATLRLFQKRLQKMFFFFIRCQSLDLCVQILLCVLVVLTTRLNPTGCVEFLKAEFKRHESGKGYETTSEVLRISKAQGRLKRMSKKLWPHSVFPELIHQMSCLNCQVTKSPRSTRSVIEVLGRNERLFLQGWQHVRLHTSFSNLLWKQTLEPNG